MRQLQTHCCPRVTHQGIRLNCIDENSKVLQYPFTKEELIGFLTSI